MTSLDPMDSDAGGAPPTAPQTSAGPRRGFTGTTCVALRLPVNEQCVACRNKRGTCEKKKKILPLGAGEERGGATPALPLAGGASGAQAGTESGDLLKRRGGERGLTAADVGEEGTASVATPAPPAPGGGRLRAAATPFEPAVGTIRDRGEGFYQQLRTEYSADTTPLTSMFDPMVTSMCAVPGEAAAAGTPLPTVTEEQAVALPYAAAYKVASPAAARTRGGARTATATATVVTTTPRKRPQLSVTHEPDQDGGGGRLAVFDHRNVDPEAGPARTTSIDPTKVSEVIDLVVDHIAMKLNAEAREQTVALRVVKLEAELALEVAQKHFQIKAVEDILSGDTVLNVKILINQLLSGTEREEALKIRDGCVESIGANAATVADMSQRQADNLARLSNLLVTGMLSKVKAGDSDPGGVLAVMMTRSAIFAKQLEDAAVSVNCGNPLDHPVCTELKKAITTCKQLGLNSVAQQLLSLLTSVLADMKVSCDTLIEWFNDRAVVVEDEVVMVLTGQQNRRRRATVLRQSEKADKTVLVQMSSPPSAAEGGAAGGDTDMGEGDGVGGAPAAAALAEEAAMDPSRAAEGAEIWVARDRVISVNDVTLSTYAIKKSLEHGRFNFPGAPLAAITRTITRVSTHQEDHFVTFLASDVCVTILDASTARTTFAERTDYRAALYRRYDPLATV